MQGIREKSIPNSVVFVFLKRIRHENFPEFSMT